MTPEMVTAVSSIIISLFTLVYSVVTKKRQAVLQNVTANRMDWIKQVREALEAFAHHYRNGNLDAMMDAEAKIEMFMRRDTPEYKCVLDHLSYCIMNGYRERDYKKLLAVSSWILARSWQRIRIDSERNIFMSNHEADRLAAQQVQPLLDIVESYDKKTS